MNLKRMLFLGFIALFYGTTLQAQVLGSCGDQTNSNKSVVQEVNEETVVSLQVHPLLLPGQQAIDFQLPAVVGNQLKNVKLSDYAGKWRVLCFFPAAFTFV